MVAQPRPTRVPARKKGAPSPAMKNAHEQVFTVRLDLATWKRLKMAAIDARKPAADLVRAAIRAHLKALREASE